MTFLSTKIAGRWLTMYRSTAPEHPAVTLEVENANGRTLDEYQLTDAEALQLASFILQSVTTRAERRQAEAAITPRS